MAAALASAVAAVAQRVPGGRAFAGGEGGPAGGGGGSGGDVGEAAHVCAWAG